MSDRDPTRASRISELRAARDLAATKARAAREAAQRKRKKELAEKRRHEEFVKNRVLWRDSDEFKRMNRWHWGVGILLCLIVGGVALAIWFYDLSNRGTSDYWLPFLVGFVTVFYGFVIAATFDRLTRQRTFFDRQRLGLAQALSEKEEALASSGNQLDLAALWAVTQQRIEYYHRIATSQSETSFRNGTIASYVGFVVLVILGVVGAFSVSVAASIAVGAVGLAGAAMASFLTATFMKSQSEASAQLRQFFLQPVEFSRLLGAERLIETLPEKDRGEAVRLVISSMIGTASIEGPQDHAKPEA